LPFLARVYSATGLSLRDSAVFILSMKKTFLAVFILCAARALLFAVPENITDLAAIATTVEGSVTLQWTSPDPGDNTGVPSGYAVRYATSDITSANFYDGWVNAYAHNWTVFASSGLPETRTLTGLTCGATLYFAVVCIDSNTVYGVWQSSSDTGGAVNTLNFAVVADSAPGAVAGLLFTEHDTYLDISWTANTEIDISSYDVEQSSFSDSGAFSLIAVIAHPGTTHQSTGLINGNTYYYRVRARDAAGTAGAYCAAAGAMPWVAVASPVFSNDTVALATDTVRFAWQPAANALGYRVINSTSGEVMADSLGIDTTFWTRAGLTPNAPAAVSVEAYNGYVTSAAARTIYTLCNLPTGFATINETTKIYISWALNENPSYTRYSLQRSSNSFATFRPLFDLVAATTWQDTGLAEGATYQYRAWATNNDNKPVTPLLKDKMEFSTVTVRVAPSAPTVNSNSQSGAADGEALLSWGASGEDGSSGRGASYTIKWSTSDIDESAFNAISVSALAAAAVDPPDTENKTITGLYPGATYWFAIKAKDSVNNYSLLSNTRTVCARDLPPQAPGNLSALALSSSTVKLNWTLPAAGTYDDRDFYKVYRATFSFSSYTPAISTFSFAHPATYFISTGLAAETTYYFHVSCLDKGDLGNGLWSQVLESAFSAECFARTPDTTAPGAITSLSAWPGASEGILHFAWDSPGDDGYSGSISGGKFRVDWSSAAKTFQLSDYRVEVATSTAPGLGNALTLTGLAGGATYYFRAWAADEAGNWSAVSGGATSWAQVDVAAPRVISSLSIVAYWRHVALSWTAPGDDDSGGALNGSYELRMSSGAPIVDTAGWNAAAGSYPWSMSWSTSTAAGAAQSITITGLANGVTHYFSLRAADEAGNWSIVSATSCAAAPSNITPAAFSLVSPLDNDIITASPRPTLAWEAASDADAAYGDSIAYTVSYSTDGGFAPAATTSVSGISGLSYGLQQDLAEDSTYFWRVRAADSDGAYIVSSSRRMRINVLNYPPAAFTLAGPASSLIVYVSTPTLSWNASSDGDPGDSITYRVDYAANDSFASYASSSGLAGTSYALPALTENATYWWRVWATDGVNYTMSASTWHFRVNASSEPPNAFNLSSPLNDTRQPSLQVTFNWEATTDPDPDEGVLYNLIYSISSDFIANSSTTISGLTQTTTAPILWGDNVDYYWKVEAVGARDGRVRTSSQVRKFYTDVSKELPSSFNLLEPAYNVLISTTVRPWFFWETPFDPDPADSVRYYIEISPNADFAGAQPIPTGTDAFYQPLANLLDQTTYYWRVRASGYQGTPATQVDTGFIFSSTGVFVISMTNNPPQSFGLVSPSNGAQVYTKTPAFSWEEAADSDHNEIITYYLYISTSADFAVMLDSAVTTSRSYTPVKLLDENMTYYWRVDAVDRKGSQTSAAAEWCFFVPELNRPVAPMGLSGQMSSDERSFTISWSSVTMNTDSTAIEDLAGYNIYRLLSVSTETVTAAAPLAFVGSGTLTWTDSTVQGGKFYFLLKAVDESGIESDISMIIDSLSPEMLTLLSSDREAVAELPGEIAGSLLAANNPWNKDLAVQLERKTEHEQGRILRSYDLKVEDCRKETIANYTFAVPLTVQFGYRSISPVSAAPAAFSQGELAVFWDNGVEYIRVAGYMDEARKKIIIKAAMPGNYQVRQVSRAAGFGLAGTYPAKVFTPGVAPYNKMYFYVDNPEGDKITGKIYDLKGEFIAELAALNDATELTVILSWEGNDAPAGVYIYQVESQKKIINGTIMVAR